jgi:hypothetical protein
MNISTINSALTPQREKLLSHPLYERVKTVDDLRHFLEGHVYAVWDFMSLLKTLQSKLTCTNTPWLPVGNPEIRYLINEIVLAEETDINAEGKGKAITKCTTMPWRPAARNTVAVNDFLADVVETQNIFVSIKQSSLHQNIKDFLDFTFRVIDEGKPS